MQHSGAMLSNLRVDPACHNSLLFPAWGWDPYVYIDEAALGAARRPRRVAALRGQLWSRAAVVAMRQNWCAPHTRPLRLAGRWGGRPFVIEDLCAPEGLAPLGGAGWLPGWQAFQKNLPRACGQACVH
ncbi:MAG: hypothetical protein FJ138_09270 [Deltaproteobacteria bacterium]|nr:hypothetical protein [Deltaproteobacteria bacterium]